ncbi:MAG TPA: hypothetical protein VIZ90_01210 [Rhizobiaceae bacterium]
MTDRLKKEKSAPAPDGEPRQPIEDGGEPRKSKVPGVEEPLIGGDAGKPGRRTEADEASVDEAGQVRRRKGDVDLLH